MWIPLCLVQENFVILLPCTQQDDNKAGICLILWYNVSLTNGSQDPGQQSADDFYSSSAEMQGPVQNLVMGPLDFFPL